MVAVDCTDGDGKGVLNNVPAPCHPTLDVKELELDFIEAEIPAYNLPITGFDS